MVLRDRLFGDPERGQRSRGTTIDQSLQQYFLDLCFREPVVEGSMDMSCQFLRTVQCREHREIEHAAGLVIQSRPGPDFPPRILSNKFLNGTAKFTGLFQGQFDVRTPHYLCTQAQTLGVPL